MRLGCAAYSYRQFFQNGELTLPQFVTHCREMGLDGVELTAYYFPDTERSTLHSLKRHCLLEGMHILGTAVGSNFTQNDSDKRREQVAMTKTWIEHSVTLGAPCIRVFAGPIPEGVTEEEAMQRAFTCLEECIAFASERGVVVALENHGGVTSRAEQVMRFVDRFSGPWFGLNLDFGNFRSDPYAEFARCAPHAVTTHVKRTLHGASGPERVDYARVVKVMRDAGYRGYFSIEYEDAEDPRAAVPDVVAHLKGCLR
jgi:sugar phosphate isomerase/epimerase